MIVPRPGFLDEPMDRGKFLRTVGLGLLMMLGGNMIVGALEGIDRANHKSVPTGGRGYSSSRYGK